MRKIILGLDLGVTSIGWALIEESNNKHKIIDMGCRIIPLSTDDKDEFSSGNKISKNQQRTLKRTQRKGYDRYQLRRKALTKILFEKEMFDERLLKVNSIELWGLRSKAVNEKISLKEFGRVLYHLNQKRGYKSSRSDSNLDKKDTDYVVEVKNRHQDIKDQGMTIGQKFYDELKKDQFYRIKQQVFPREAYIEEFEAICKEQKKHHPSIITDEFISILRDEIIYYQRKLKSQKDLVAVCEFEGFWVQTKEEKKIFVGPKVAPKSSPIFQVCKIWESINTLTLKNKTGGSLEISIDQKRLLFNYLDNNEKMSAAKLFEILNLNKNDGWYGNKQIDRGIQGNLTKVQLLKELPQDSPFLKFDIPIHESEKDTFLVDRKTGEISKSNTLQFVEASIEKQPLYRLWHTIYSIADVEECANALLKQFDIERNIALKLASIDFNKMGFGNKSAKSMRKILPYLMQGEIYSNACSYAGYNHSWSLTKDENAKRALLDKIPNLQKNSLRQPVVEKIINQMINLVNSLVEKHGRPKEIRVELARELKQSKDERSNTFANLSKRERENEAIRKRLLEEYNLRATRNMIIKWRLFHEINNLESKANAMCIYCGKPFGITDALNGNNVDVEHIIPKSLLFDDSQSNKTLSHRNCNEAKNNNTAFDFMSSKSAIEFNAYLERVDNLFKNKLIGKAKRDKFLMPEAKIPKDFIERQLRETQYISRKSKEILEQICVNVWSTSGNVTEYLRRIWGWDEVLMNLQLPKYKQLGLTEWKEWANQSGQMHKTEVIKEWTKRDDHRHHAIDALVIACTQQGFIQRINNLSSKGNRQEMYDEVGKTSKGNLLENYFRKLQPFNTKEVESKAAEILISFKPGKKVASLSKRKIVKNGKKQTVQTGIIVPRGALSEESVYGKIKSIERNKPIKYLFENPELIINTNIRNLIIDRLSLHDNDIKKAISSLRKDPIYLDKEKKILLEYGSCYKDEVVIKKPISSLNEKQIEDIVDPYVKSKVRERLELFGGKAKDAFKDLDNNPIWFNKEKNIPIKSVRWFSGLSVIQPVNKAGLGFVKPGNNHHMAFYTDSNGNKVIHGCTFWHAVQRKQFGVPVIIKNPKDVWDKISLNEFPQEFLNKLPHPELEFIESMQQNEMFILGLNKEELDHTLSINDKSTINKYLYRVQKMSIKGNGHLDITFRHHLETKINDSTNSKISLQFYNVQSVSAFEKLNPKKIRINTIGEIVT